MAVEIERKFLLRGDGWRARVQKSRRMAQGYLGGDLSSVRVRIAGEQAWLNIKSLELGIQRLEYEYPIPVEDAHEMLEKLCGSKVVEKTRNWVEYAGKCWEIDEFHGKNAGLIVAELELDDPEEPFERPPWLGREVTDEARYYNVALVSHPYSQWQDDESTRP